MLRIRPEKRILQCDKADAFPCIVQHSPPTEGLCMFDAPIEHILQHAVVTGPGRDLRQRTRFYSFTHAAEFFRPGCVDRLGLLQAQEHALKILRRYKPQRSRSFLTPQGLQQRRKGDLLPCLFASECQLPFF